MNNGDRCDEPGDGQGEGHLYDPYEGYGYRRYGDAEGAYDEGAYDEHGPEEPAHDDQADEEHESDERWYEDETGAMVRPYTVTRGRTRPSGRHAVDLMSRVTALDPETAPVPGVEHAGAALLDLIRRGPRPLVELAVDADLPLTIVRVLLGDLAEAGLIRIDAPRRLPVTGPAADPELLREIVHRLRRI
ncbi:DUF742 domain-containing protein [Streptomyces sp. NPDC026659]|uniref:DUF742 domain-containing protein n=1 Tax=Streptomyces sp. NPDC026659 TaxID=3155123 RepID=UPI0033E1CB22